MLSASRTDVFTGTMYFPSFGHNEVVHPVRPIRAGDPGRRSGPDRRRDQLTTRVAAVSPIRVPPGSNAGTGDSPIRKPSAR